jgi:dethiobiotin synthetase
MGKIIFITGTDTGAGKTHFTVQLLALARQAGMAARAMKPFCAGGRGDVRKLQAQQPGELSDARMNPWWQAKPIAPGAAGLRGPKLSTVMKRIQAEAAQCELLVVEGVGGVMVPLTCDYLVLDVIAGLGCACVVVARNRLGTLNHTLLTLQALTAAGVKRKVVVLRGERRADASARNNARVLKNWLGAGVVVEWPFMRDKISANGQGNSQKDISKKMKIIVARLLGVR